MAMQVTAVRGQVRHRVRSIPDPLKTRPTSSLSSVQVYSDLSVVVHRPIDELKSNNHNARRHPEKQLKRLTASVIEFGFNCPVLIDGDDNIIAGHARVIAAQRAGLTRVPTITLTHLDPSKLRAYMLADNKLAEGAEWDFQVLKTELADLHLDLSFDCESIGFEPVECDLIIHGDDEDASEHDEAAEEALPPLRKSAVTRRGDLYLLGERHVLLCGDALDARSYERILGHEKARLVITDSPYNVPIDGHASGLGKHQHREFAMASGEMGRPEFTGFLKTAFGFLAAYSVDGALHYLFMDHRHLEEMLAAAGAVYTERKNLLVWKKTNAGMGSHYRSQHELIFLYKNGTAPHINNVQLGATGRYRTNVLEYAGATTFRKGRDEELAAHPTPKPVALIAELIRDSSNINDWVLDCFVGGGTIFIAAEQTTRRAAGIEIDPIYCDLCIERWQAFTGQSAVLAETGETFAQVAERRRNEEKDAAPHDPEVRHG